MARDTDGIIQQKYAETGDVGLGGLDLSELWPIAYSTPGGLFPQRIQFNQLFRYLSALSVEMNQGGPYLDYSPLIDYKVGANIRGSDGEVYGSAVANGPGSSVVDPVGDNTGTWALSSIGIQVDSIDQLRNHPGSFKNQTAIVLGQSEAGDGGGGVFRWAITATIPDDKGIIIQATGVSVGRWERQYSGSISTRWFPTVSDAFAVFGDINIDGQYEITDRIAVQNNITITQSFDSYIQNTDKTLATIEGRPSTDNGVFQVACGNKRITFDGLDIRGAWYGEAQPYRDNNIGINISGRFDQFRLSQPLVGTSYKIKIKNCSIEGFGQSGVIADQINNFEAYENTIKNCGRDGIRMYGCRDFKTNENTISDMSPGYDGIAPHLNVYGISATTVYQQPLADYRASSNGIIQANNVENCSTWKSLDTHGGENITFANNTCLNSHIGIGIDKGGLDDLGNLIPAKKIRVFTNSIIHNAEASDTARAGITIFADGSGDAVIGRDVQIADNYIEGYGTDLADGAIHASNQYNLTIDNNIIKNSLKSAIQLANQITSCNVTDNLIRNVIESTGGIKDGITTVDMLGNVTVDGNRFMADATPFNPMTIPNTVGLDIYYGGSNRTLNCLDVVGIGNSVGGLINENIGWGLIISDGSFSSGFGLTSTKTGTGIYEVTVNGSAYTKLAATVSALSNAGDYANIRDVVGNVITVRTYDSTGTLKDSAFYINVNGYR